MERQPCVWGVVNQVNVYWFSLLNLSVNTLQIALRHKEPGSAALRNSFLEAPGKAEEYIHGTGYAGVFKGKLFDSLR
jgi:hypothetical protein